MKYMQTLMIPSQTPYWNEPQQSSKKQQMRSLGFIGQRRNLGFQMQLLHWQMKEGRLGRRLFQDPSFRHEYNHLTRSIHKGLNADKEKWFNGKCQLLETNMQQNKSKEVFNTIKTITKRIDRSPTSSSIRSSSGELLSNPDEVKQRWFEYGKALYNHQPTNDSSVLTHQSLDLTTLVSLPSFALKL